MLILDKAPDDWWILFNERNNYQKNCFDTNGAAGVQIRDGIQYLRETKKGYQTLNKDYMKQG